METSDAILVPLSCLLIGSAVGTLAWSADDEFSRAFAFVEHDLSDKLRRLRMPAGNLRRYIISWLVLTGVNFVTFVFVLGSPIFAVLISAFLVCSPWYLLRRMAQRRRQKIEDQLADAMVMLANAVRAGLSLAQAMDVLAAQCPSPINYEFRQIVGEYNMGKPLEQTLQEARNRLRSENFALFAAAMMASHQSGGRLNEVVERIAQSVLELQRLERKVQSETAQARKSAVYMSVAPAFILVVYYFIDPASTMRLFTEPIGHLLLAAAVVLDVVAYFWARWILSRIFEMQVTQVQDAVLWSAAALPLAVSPFGIAQQVVASLLLGAAIAVLVWWVFRVLESDDVAQGHEWRYDVSRMNELRRIDPLYRLFQPILTVLARMNRVIFAERMPEMHRQIQASGLPRFWLPEEYLARMEILALCSTPLWIYILFWVFGPEGMLLSPVAIVATGLFLRYRLAVRAAGRLRQIKRRMPYLLDLLTLLMEAGATFLNALNQAVDEFRGHPVSEEFGRVLADMNLGKTRMEAFQAMRDRLADDEITSIIGTIIQGEHLGTPLARIFRSQADVLRVKRSQRAESIAGEAGVNMLMPAVLVMAATVLIILGPFLLNFLKFGLSI